jgi:misacylated tRNA(Ala) deacylase
MLTKLLTCAPEEHESRTDKVLQFQKSAVKDIKNMQKEIAVLVAEKILNECEENSESFGVVHYHREEGDMVFMQSLLAALGDARNQYVFVLSVGKSSSEGMFMIAGPSEFVTAHAKEVVGIIDGKGGGGKNGTYQGKAKSMKKMSDLVNKLKELRVSSCSG